MFDKQNQSFYCFFFVCFCNWSTVFAQEFLLKGERKWVMCFFWFAIEIFLECKSFSFERRKESG